MIEYGYRSWATSGKIPDHAIPNTIEELQEALRHAYLTNRKLNRRNQILERYNRAFENEFKSISLIKSLLLNHMANMRQTINREMRELRDSDKNI